MALNRLPVTAPRSANDLIFLRQRFIEGAERPSGWPDIESASPGDAPKAVQILCQAGQAYIHTLKSLLEETQGYLPDELASRIAERCAFTDIHAATVATGDRGGGAVSDLSRADLGTRE